MAEKEKKEKREQAKEQKPLYDWVFHPARANRLVTSLVTVFLFLLLVIVYWLTESRLFTIIGAVVLLASMRSFYFPTTYKLYDDYIEVIYTISRTKKNWEMYRSIYPERNGVFLSTFTRPSRLENFRGLFLRYGEGDPDRILGIVKSKIGALEDEREDVSPSAQRGAGEG
ncbi:MAG: hypothetical protein GWO41_10240 [candidate division Zixibacteria bacterium]|nr:hypothetical protein [candidate division Zixibacteria bacterium]NIR64586.1 hypothetical protein [candidate division Zixibacteria bacterium]NIS16709.1 hypothetical protein [candidate division Zixibacteria bacterium]NIS46444.1 hypothetical protein [candidate division Zixibacteria bacterium]NIT53098.1 hypothetical protein [candidate division Zixibacteria bacterium]